MLVDRRVKGPVETRHPVRREEVRIAAHCLGVAVDNSAEADRTAWLIHDHRLAVEIYQRIGEIAQCPIVDRIPRQGVGQEGIVGKPAHFQYPLLGWSLTAKHKAALPVFRDWMDGNIKIWRRPAIEPQLSIQRRFAFLRRREVEIAKVDRALNFPGAVTVEKDACCMGIDALDRPASGERRPGV